MHMIKPVQGVQVEGEDKKEVDMEENAERRDEHCKESRSSKLKQSKRKEELESELTGTVDGDGDQENDLYSLLPGRHLQTKLLFTLLSMVSLNYMHLPLSSSSKYRICFLLACVCLGAAAQGRVSLLTQFSPD